MEEGRTGRTHAYVIHTGVRQSVKLSAVKASFVDYTVLPGTPFQRRQFPATSLYLCPSFRFPAYTYTSIWSLLVCSLLMDKGLKWESLFMIYMVRVDFLASDPCQGRFSGTYIPLHYGSWKKFKCYDSMWHAHYIRQL